MAYENQSFATLGVNLNRQNYGALDISQVFANINDFNYYLTKGQNQTNVSDYWKNIIPYPYEGQVVATVINGVVSVYVLTLDSSTGFFAALELGNKTYINDEITKAKDEVKGYVDGKIAWGSF